MPNGTFTWKLEADGLEPGHAYSIWVGNFEGFNGLDFAAPGGGGGVVSGSWKQWTDHLLEFLKELERLIWPDLFIIGGGISAEFRSFCEGLRTATPVTAATLGNDAGIVGAAIAI